MLVTTIPTACCFISSCRSCTLLHFSSCFCVVYSFFPYFGFRLRAKVFCSGFRGHIPPQDHRLWPELDLCSYGVMGKTKVVPLRRVPQNSPNTARMALHPPKGLLNGLSTPWDATPRVQPEPLNVQCCRGSTQSAILEVGATNYTKCGF